MCYLEPFICEFRKYYYQVIEPARKDLDKLIYAKLPPIVASKVEATLEESGNLSYGIIKFDINLQQRLSLTDENLDSSIIIKYELKRDDLIKENSKPFSVTYQINYALTNSHHSLTFMDKEVITIEDLFRPIIRLETPLKIVKAEPSRRSIQQDPRKINQVKRLTQSERFQQKELEDQDQEEDIKNITIIHQNQDNSEIETLKQMITDLSNRI
ncbi:hypothetical protein LINPERPRIM_LOCUS39152 [Linum perenne]